MRYLFFIFLLFSSYSIAELYTLEQFEVAKTIWSESRGESYDCSYAVASVIYNRSKLHSKSFSEVIHEPYQFSGWNEGCITVVITNSVDNKKWEECLKLSLLIYKDNFNPVINATHFCSINKKPSWTYEYKFICNFGNLNFYE